MKTWMKALMWFGLGGGIGFFAGFQLGSRGRGRMITTAYEEGKNDGYFACALDTSTYEAEAGDAFSTYRGEDLDEDGFPNESPSEDEDDEEDDSAMREPPPPIDDFDVDGDEIPQLHPQDLTPEPIDEYNYYTNPWGLYKEQLYYYEVDKVLYNQDTHEAIQNPNKIDQLLGVGMLFNFYKSDGEALDAIFVKNDTLGMIFRIDRIDASYADEIVGADAPDYQEEDEDTE